MFMTEENYNWFLSIRAVMGQVPRQTAKPYQNPHPKRKETTSTTKSDTEPFKREIFSISKQGGFEVNVINLWPSYLPGAAQPIAGRL